jgi:hypothetical protein
MPERSDIASGILQRLVTPGMIQHHVSEFVHQDEIDLTGCEMVCRDQNILIKEKDSR